MDKGFNDQELADIMNEIEELEKDVEDAPVAEAAVEEEPACEVTALPTKENKQPQWTASSPAQSSMSFKVSGQMTIDLQFDVAGESVGVSVSESGLTIQMSNGTSLNVPLQPSKTFKKSA